jgi:diacylglycerol kinase family enzyme
MFFYFYDNFVNDKKYADDLQKIEHRLIELGINGRIEKFSILRNVIEMINDAIKKGAHTIIAVGNDNTFLKLSDIVSNHDVTFGFIPLESSKVARILGINNAIEACNILSKRLIKKINIGKANDHYFIASLSMPEVEKSQIECDGKYKINFSTHGELHVYNLGNFLEESDEKEWKLFSGSSNHLHMYLTPKNKASSLLKFFPSGKKEKDSILRAKKIKITSSDVSLPVILDQTTTVKTPVNITYKAKRISLIVGKDRKI